MITLDDVRRARETIAGAVKLTPCLHSRGLSKRCGTPLYLKYETHQVTGSFKARGAYNTLHSLTDGEKERGVVTASAGNHAQGVAWAASEHGVSSVIVMPETTPLIKVTRTRQLGGRVRLHGSTYDDAYAEASKLRDQDDYVYVHAFEDERVIAGQGTIGLELLEQVEDLEAVVVPIGGGGLISGIATAIKESRPGVEIYGVQTEAAPAMKESFAAGELMVGTTARSIAEGIVMKRPGKLTFEHIQRYVDDVVLTSEQAIESAIFDLIESDKTVAEGAGAAGLAAMLSDRLPQLQGKRTAVILCGGNIDLSFLAKIIDRALVRRSRLCRLRVTVPDHPGGLAAALSVIAAKGASIDRIRQSRIFTNSTFWEVEAEITLETRDAEHVSELVEKLRSEGYRVEDLGPRSIV